MTKKRSPKWYAVKQGRCPGVYPSWPECQAQIERFPGCIHKSFKTYEEALAFAGTAGQPNGAQKRHASDNLGAPDQSKRSRFDNFSYSTQQRQAHTSSVDLEPSAASAGLCNDGLRATAAITPPSSDCFPWRVTALEAGGFAVPKAPRLSPAGSKASARGSGLEGWVYFDGGARGNPGPAGCGAALYLASPDAPSPAAHHATASAFLGATTNNVAEYEGLLLGLLLARDAGVARLHVRGDSKLVLKQLDGSWAAHKPHLQALLGVSSRLLSRFDEWDVCHVYREGNGLADSLANEAMDSRDVGAGQPSERVVELLRADAGAR